MYKRVFVRAGFLPSTVRVYKKIGGGAASNILIFERVVWNKQVSFNLGLTLLHWNGVQTEPHTTKHKHTPPAGSTMGFACELCLVKQRSKRHSFVLIHQSIAIYVFERNSIYNL